MAEAPALTAATWAALRTRRPVVEHNLVVEVLVERDGKPRVEAGMDCHGELHLLVSTTNLPPAELPPDLNGVRVRCRRGVDGGAAVDIVAPPSHERVFTPFCLEVIHAVTAEGRDSWAATAAIIRSWRSAWNQPRSDFPPTTQVGLYGELWVLSNVLAPIVGTRVVDLWSGPEGDRHDFIGDAVHVETKTTRRSELRFIISRQDQLKRPPEKRLLFAAVRVRESGGYRDTVATMIDHAVSVLSEDGSAIDMLLGKLANIGWHEGLRTSGDLVRLGMESIDFYEVDAAFPRLPDDFVRPSGVVKIEYEIDLANLAGMSEEQVKDSIREM